MTVSSVVLLICIIITADYYATLLNFDDCVWHSGSSSSSQFVVKLSLFFFYLATSGLDCILAEVISMQWQ